jgi:peptidoglycan/xylan/chitin deacetylase (PgdA/CDA1 family)
VTPRTVVLTFDNLGEAAEIEQGKRDHPVGDHPSVTTALPRLLDELDDLDLRATFFVEGLNTQLYPDAVREIASRGHEIGMHGWLHERWGEVEPAEQADILARCREAFGRCGITPRGFRPPGGQLGERGLATLRDAGIDWCSPEGETVEVEDGMALLPFRWELVDATYLHPGFGALRRRLGLPEEALHPEDFERRLFGELEMAPEAVVVIMHPFLMLDNAAWAAARRILERLRELRVTPGGALADELR